MPLVHMLWGLHSVRHCYIILLICSRSYSPDPTGKFQRVGGQGLSHEGLGGRSRSGTWQLFHRRSPTETQVSLPLPETRGMGSDAQSREAIAHGTNLLSPPHSSGTQYRYAPRMLRGKRGPSSVLPPPPEWVGCWGRTLISRKDLDPASILYARLRPRALLNLPAPRGPHDSASVDPVSAAGLKLSLTLLLERVVGIVQVGTSREDVGDAQRPRMAVGQHAPEALVAHT